MQHSLSSETLLLAYANGVFPMAESQDSPELFWVDPRQRGIIPLDAFHVSRSLARRLRSGVYQTSLDTAFSDVVAGCADREETWINAPLKALYQEIFEQGTAHSVEVWDRNSKLVGGVFGIALGGAFFGESMFSTATDASKVALADMVTRLRQAGFVLFDTQFITPHLRSLGAIEIPRAQYRTALEQALQLKPQPLE